jgi:magnesium transporter
MRAKGQKRRRRRALSTAPGAPPGTLTVSADAASPVIRVMAYGPSDYVEQPIDDLESVPPLLERWPVTWVNVDGLGDRDVLARLGEIFDLHPLSLEDVLNVHQRPKVEQYDRYHFIVTRMTALGERLETEQLSLFLGENFVLTLQEHPGDCLDPVRERIRKGLGRIRAAGADYLAYALVDAVVDAYFPVLEEFGERLEALEDEVVERADRSTIARIHGAKRDLLTLRRAMWPQREAINSLLRDAATLITQETRVYLRDCYDHAVQIIDMVETYRELASGLLDFYLSSVSNRMNEVMKVLTVIATIFIPLTFIAGIYGMNFNPERSAYNMPELNWRWGYPAVWLVMAAVAVAMLMFFRRRGWLGSAASRERTRPTGSE